ncbi:MAG: hypothetical protein HXY35_05470 [Chloroflexi bacterium]|nr:hypothetical protein [Chloroflexota bacterium]
MAISLVEAEGGNPNGIKLALAKAYWMVNNDLLAIQCLYEVVDSKLASSEQKDDALRTIAEIKRGSKPPYTDNPPVFATPTAAYIPPP